MSAIRKLQRHKKFVGSSVLVSALITAAASAMIGYGITKMLATGIDSINNQQVKMQAQQYAASRVNVLRSVRYDSLAEMNKKQIGDTDYYEQVTKMSSTEASDDTKGSAVYQVAVYKGADSDKPITTMNFSRSNPGVLLDNQVESNSGNADTSALIESALKTYTNSKFGEDSESQSSDKAMGIKSFISYVDGLLSKYRINAVAAWNIESSDTFDNNGSSRKPIYIGKGSKYNYAAQGSVTYSMSGNSDGYIATLTEGSDGIKYIDYTEKPEETKDPTTNPPTGGNVSGTSLPEEDTLLQYIDWTNNCGSVHAGTIDPNKGSKTTIQIPNNVNVIKITAIMEQEGEEPMAAGIMSQTGKIWILEQSTLESIHEFTPYYIKVTPGATYTLIDNGYSGNDAILGGASLYYSKSINEHTPDITDLI